MANGTTAFPVMSYITGNDLRIMRIEAKYTTADMADIMGVLSRKTIENWEQGASAPRINQFIIFCTATGFHPWLVIREVLRRNEEDPSQKKYFQLDLCVKR